MDIQTWSGDNVDGKDITHALGSAPGMVIFKPINNTGGWYVYHTEVGFNNSLKLDSTSDAIFGPSVTAKSSTTITVSDTN